MRKEIFVCDVCGSESYATFGKVKVFRPALAEVGDPFKSFAHICNDCATKIWDALKTRCAYKDMPI